MKPNDRKNFTHCPRGLDTKELGKRCKELARSQGVKDTLVVRKATPEELLEYLGGEKQWILK